MKELIEQYKELTAQHNQARKQYATIGNQLNKLSPKLERGIEKSLNDEFKDDMGKLQVQIIADRLRIWVERHAQKEATHEFKIGHLWVCVSYPQDEYVGSYKSRTYKTYDEVAPKLKKFIKELRIGEIEWDYR